MAAVLRMKLADLPRSRDTSFGFKSILKRGVNYPGLIGVNRWRHFDDFESDWGSL